MKKTLLALFLILALCLSGCAADSGTPAPTAPSIDLWEDVTGDTLKLTIAQWDMTAILNKDGSASLSAPQHDYVAAAEYGEQFQEFSAEMGIISRHYGTFRMEGETILFSLSAQSYYCFDVRGKDARAFKEAYLEYRRAETPTELERIEAAFGDGYPEAESEDTIRIKCSYISKTLKLQSVQSHTKDGTLIHESIMNADGSYTSTGYKDGKIAHTKEYDSNNNLVKATNYRDDGTIEYIEQTIRGENGTTTTRTDAEGNIIYLDENITEEYEGGERHIQRRTENGEVVDCEIRDHHNDGTLVITTTQHEGDVETFSIEVHSIINSEFYLYKQTNAGKLTAYQCHRKYPADSVPSFRSVTFDSAKDVFIVVARFADGGENEHEIPASDYVHGTWEDYAEYL